jgi:hypothetical protein
MPGYGSGLYGTELYGGGSGPSESGVAPAPATVGPSGRLSINITKADGRSIRLGPDEVDAAMVPMGLTFGTAMPGGNTTGSFQLLVRIDLETPIELFDDVTVVGAGGEVAWNGYITSLPRSHGDAYGITPAAVGYATALKDRPDFREVYVDRDVSAWTGATSQRAINLHTATHEYVSPEQNGTSSLTTAFQDAWAGGVVKRSEAWYDAGVGLTVAKLYWDWQEVGGVNTADTDANWAIGNSTTADHASLALDASTGNLRTQGRQGYWTPANARRYVAAWLNYNTTPSGTAGVRYAIDWRNWAMYGNHGLTLHGTDPQGVYASDVIADVLSRSAPELTYSTGADGSIAPSTFTIPHLVFKEPVTAEDAILFVNAYHQWEWGVYDGREFFWRPTDPDRTCWEARLSEGAHINLEGQQAADTVNGVFVSYTDPLGVRKTAGPPGSNADDTSATLADTSDDNPLNKQGRTKWARMDISQVTTSTGAVQLGAIWLAEQAVPQRRGTITVKGSIEHPTRGLRPTWAVRAGDYVRIPDHATDVPRRIIQTDYRHDTREVQMDVGTSPHKLDALLARLNVASISRY